jgi:dTDP-glucose pyrophosphorylase
MGAAGEGVVKALLPVAGRPLVAWLLDMLGPRVTDVCFVVPPGPDLEERFRDATGRMEAIRSVSFVVQPVPLGVGEAVLRAEESVCGPFVVVMGDGYFSHSLAPSLEAWKQSDADGAVLVELPSARVVEPSGWVRMDGNRVRACFKAVWRRSADWRLAGMAVLPESVFTLEGPAPSPDTGEVELEQLILGLIHQGVTFRALPYEHWRSNVNRSTNLDLIERRIANLAATGRLARQDERSGS